MRLLRWISGKTKRDRHQNEEIHSKIRIAPIDEKVQETRLRWFCHVQRRVTNDTIIKSKFIQVKSSQAKPSRTREKKGERPTITLVQLHK